MTKYFYTPFTDHSDRALAGTRRRYGTLQQLQDLARVLPGDVLYFNAHGLEGDAGRVQAQHRGPSRRARLGRWKFGAHVFPGRSHTVGMTTDEVADLMTGRHNLQDGAPGGPIRIKCLVCFAGGDELDHDQAEQQLAGNRYVTLGLADNHFAHNLARALGARRRDHILVGGYPGEIRAEPRNVSSMIYNDAGVMVEQSAINVSGHVAWFDCQGSRVTKTGQPVV